ncbi:MAG: hypothetical protein CSB44_12125 [Gammaproteobacteria bacterium]|nr:MAG: hypothetical protein CSB44_12125 [Gammaproteobacteria bacterium]
MGDLARAFEEKQLLKIERRKRRQQERDRHVRRVFERHGERYGAPRIQRELAAEGLHANEKTIAAILGRQGLKAKAARKLKATKENRKWALRQR